MPQAPSTVSIAMHGVELVVRIGEHAWERHPERPTRLAINITLTFSYGDYFSKHGGYVDYDPLWKFLKSLEQRDHIDRLEDFGKLIAATCFAITPAARVKLSVMKPDIFHEMEAVGLEFDVDARRLLRMSGLVLVTGAGRRVGAGIARRLARDGWTIGVHFNGSRAGAEDVANAIRADGGAADLFSADLTDENAVDAMTADLAQRGDWVGLVNSAASFSPDTIADFTLDAAQAQLRLNLLAPIYLSRKLHEAVRGKFGFVTNIADQKVLNPNPDFLSYTLAKVGLAHSTAVLAMALAPNVRVNCIAAGLMLISGDQSAENFERVHKQTLTGMGTRVEDVADCVAFLAKAQNMTGALVPVDGGQHLVPSARDVMFD